MDKLQRQQLAYDTFKKGYNCCQSVVLAFADILPLPEKTLENLTLGFGAGYGRTRNICGTVTAFGFVLGLLYDKHDEIAKEKEDMYKQLQELIAKFKQLNGTEICGDLLKNVKKLTQGYVPQVRDEEYYKARPCAKFVTDSAGILHEYLESKGCIK